MAKLFSKSKASYFQKNNLYKIIDYYSNLKVNKIYHPTLFWKSLITKNIDQIRKNGLENFRNSKNYLSGFIPLYSLLNHINNKKIIYDLEKQLKKSIKIKKRKIEITYKLKNFLKGADRANLQFHVLLTDTSKPYFYEFKESKIGNPSEVFNFGENRFSASSLNYLTGLLFLKNKIKNLDNKTFLEIGGGFGSLGEILNKLYKKVKYINLDLFPLNIVCENYLRRCFNVSVKNHLDFANKDKINIGKLGKLNCFLNSDIDKLVGSVDIFINFISFQEMRLDVVNNYINKLNRLKPKYILIRNIREGKKDKKSKHMPNVEKKITKTDYLTLFKKNYKFVASNVEPYGHKTWDGFHSELILFKKINH